MYLYNLWTFNYLVTLKIINTKTKIILIESNSLTLTLHRYNTDSVLYNLYIVHSLYICKIYIVQSIYV